LECEVEDTDFVSIPAAAWWALPTVTGVGYGDMIPQTLGGKMAGACTMVGGVLITSLSVAVTTNSFIEHFQRNMQRAKVAKRLRTTISKDLARPTQSLARLSVSCQDLASLVYDGDHEQGNLNPRLPKIERELQELLMDLQANLTDVHASPSTMMYADDGREALLTCLELLQEQNKVWFKQVQRVADDILRMHMGTIDRERTEFYRTSGSIGGGLTPAVSEQRSPSRASVQFSDAIPFPSASADSGITDA